MKKFFIYLKPYKYKFIFCIFLMLLLGIVSSFSLSLVLPFLRAIFYGITNQSNDLLAKFSNWFLSGTKLQLFVRLESILLIAFVLKGVLDYAHKYIVANIEESLMKDLRDKTYTHLQSLSLEYFYNEKSGKIISSITNDIFLINGALKEGVFALLREYFLIFAYTCLAIYISWELFFITSITFPLLALFLSKLSKKLREKSDKIQENMAEISNLINESIVGIKVIKAFCMEARERKKFLTKTKEYFKSAIKFQKIALLGVPISEILVAIGACILISYGGYKILLLKTLSPDRFLLFLVCAIAIMESVRDLHKYNAKLQIGQQALIRIERILSLTPKIIEKHEPIEIKFDKEIIFDNVHFSYDDKKVLNGINLKIKKGEKIGLVGHSGVGKTTIIDLLLRFYEPTKGKIMIDDIDIKEAKISSLRKLFGIVPQEPILFNDTIYNNIAYDNVEPSQVYHSAEIAGANEFIEKMAKKYDTIVGEMGAKLSGGEKQRIAIARAIVKNPPIIIFDEATSNIDRETEIKLQATLEKVFKDRTVIVIAHRLETIKKLDRIVVIEDGKVVEEGTHDFLIKNGKYYKKLMGVEIK